MKQKLPAVFVGTCDHFSGFAHRLPGTVLQKKECITLAKSGDEGCERAVDPAKTPPERKNTGAQDRQHTKRKTVGQRRLEIRIRRHPAVPMMTEVVIAHRFNGAADW